MKILQNKITHYTSTNLTENEPEWSVLTMFNYADEIRDGHNIYKYAGEDGTNTTDSPSLNNLKLKPRWVKIRPTNYYAMLDCKTNTQTQNENSIIVEFAYMNYNTLSLLDVVAQDITITLTDNISLDVIYTKNISLVDNSAIIDFTTYCFNEIIQAGSLFSDEIPLYSNATLKVEINNAGGVAKCGRLVCGRSYYIGETAYGMNLGMESYSRKNIDEFGNVTLVHINNVNLDSYEVSVKTEAIPNIRRKMKDLDAVPVLFIMDESQNSQMENLLTYGYYESFDIMIPGPVLSTASVTIKGVL